MFWLTLRAFSGFLGGAPLHRPLEGCDHSEISARRGNAP